MSEHYTPGPWILAHPREDEPEIYIADIHDREGNWIADVWCEPPHASANARLIAAAPDLLEAIKVALEDLVNYELKDEEIRGRNRSYDHMEAEESWSETIYKIREAIKLAGGE